MKGFFDSKMKNSKRTKHAAFWCLALILVVAIALGLRWSKTAITFLEHTSSSESFSAQSFRVLSGNEQISQEINMPYNIFHSISLAINDFGRTNNSTYNLQIRDHKNNVVMEKDFSPSQLPENGLLEIGAKNVSVDTEEKYRLVITPKDVSSGTEVGFFYDSNSGELFYDIYGGEYRFWWTGFVIFCAVVLILTFARAFTLIRKGLPLLGDRLFKSMLVFLAAFALASVYSVGGYFTDEYDNMQGGMVIAQGGVLYKDYVTQHTPFTYYLCAFFNSLGAESITQFRLMFYALYSLVWAFVYFRYSKGTRSSRILILGGLITCALPCIFSSNLQLLYDNIQMLCFIVLMFEFLRYYKEEKPSLGWARSIIISSGIYLSIGSAFNSVYTLTAFGIGFLFLEVKYWIKARIFSFSQFVKRYNRLMVALLIPLIVILGYFLANSALNDAVEQAYLFNTKVYSDYYKDGYGTNLVAPFLIGIGNYLAVIGSAVQNIIKTRADFNTLFMVGTFIISAYAIFKQFRDKKYILGAVTLMVICFSFSRESFHTISAWAIMLFASVILFPTIQKKVAEWKWLIISPCILFLIVPYYNGYMKPFLLYKQPPVSEFEKYIIDHTEVGDYIGVDSYIHDSLYFQYKGRKIANKNAYILPWYLVWYEDSVIDDYKNNQPSAVVFNPATKVWGLTDFSPKLSDYVYQNYNVSSEQPYIWLKK